MNPGAVRRDFPIGGAVALGLVTVLAVVLALGGWAAGAPLAGAVLASGRLEPAADRVTIEHPEGGVVAEMAVAEGMTVARGTVLLRLDPGPLAADLQVARSRLHEIRARRARLEAERDERAAVAFPDDLRRAATADPATAAMLAGQRRLFATRADLAARETRQRAAQADRIAALIAGLDRQEAALAEEAALLRETLAVQESLLARRLTEAARVAALKQELARLAGRRAEIEAAAAQAAAQRAGLALEGTQARARRREAAIAELRDLLPLEIEAQERARDIARRIAGLTLRAPVAGTVHGLRLRAPGEVAAPGDPILTLIPEGRPLTAVLRIRPGDVDRVAPGQPVRLRLPGLGGRDAPEFAGQVLALSADVFADERGSGGFYRAEVGFDSAAAGPAHLIPGMPVEAYLSTGPRRPLDYLMRPVRDYFARAWREG